MAVRALGTYDFPPKEPREDFGTDLLIYTYFEGNSFFVAPSAWRVPPDMPTVSASAGSPSSVSTTDRPCDRDGDPGGRGRIERRLPLPAGRHRRRGGSFGGVPAAGRVRPGGMWRLPGHPPRRRDRPVRSGLGHQDRRPGDRPPLRTALPVHGGDRHRRAPRSGMDGASGAPLERGAAMTRRT
ncbi:MAG: hypothetical protein E6G66_07705 [Actinobacteria bacterium]|nr:MAG: hypothetical protein E6G66_07705 [Actinomycetota bacterium]